MSPRGAALAIALALVAATSVFQLAAATGTGPAMVQRNELGGIDGKAAGRAAEVGYVPPQMELAAQLYAADRNRPIGQGSRTGSGTTASDSESSESHSSNSSSESDASSSDARCLTSVADARVLVYMAVAGCAASMLGGF